MLCVTITQSVSNNVRLVLVGLTHEMLYTADLSCYSICSRFERKRPIRRSLIVMVLFLVQRLRFLHH